MPLFVRKFFVDFAETFIAALIAVQFVFPTSVDQAKQVVIAVGVAAGGALVSALRRSAPDFINWLKSVLGVG